MTPKDRYRHEFKYRCTEAELLIIKNRLQNILPFDKHADGGFYTIRSMYFDNYANRCYYENEHGVSPREKFRIRIYNASDKRISLECKRKEGDKTYKTSCLLTREDYDMIINGGEIADLENKPPLLRRFVLLIKTQMFKPTVIVEYERVPYVYKVGNVRVTMDMNIRSSNAFDQFFSKELPTREILPCGQHLLEVKYDELIPDFIKEVLQLDNLQRSTFSKYYLCRKLSLGGVL